MILIHNKKDLPYWIQSSEVFKIINLNLNNPLEIENRFENFLVKNPIIKNEKDMDNLIKFIDRYQINDIPKSLFEYMEKNIKETINYINSYEYFSSINIILDEFLSKLNINLNLSYNIFLDILDLVLKFNTKIPYILECFIYQNKKEISLYIKNKMILINFKGIQLEKYCEKIFEIIELIGSMNNNTYYYKISLYTNKIPDLIKGDIIIYRNKEKFFEFPLIIKKDRILKFKKFFEEIEIQSVFSFFEINYDKFGNKINDNFPDNEIYYEILIFKDELRFFECNNSEENEIGNIKINYNIFSLRDMFNKIMKDIEAQF